MRTQSPSHFWSPFFQDLGTDKALGTMIEGESLLNDGSAVVLFQVLMNWIQHGGLLYSGI